LIVEPGGIAEAMSNCRRARRATLLSVVPEKIELQSPELLSGKSSAIVLSILGFIVVVAAKLAGTTSVKTSNILDTKINDIHSLFFIT
jgi:hypothetical protein